MRGLESNLLTIYDEFIKRKRHISLNDYLQFRTDRGLSTNNNDLLVFISVISRDKRFQRSYVENQTVFQRKSSISKRKKKLTITHIMGPNQLVKDASLFSQNQKGIESR